MDDEKDYIIKDYYCLKTGKHKPQRWIMQYCIECNTKRSHLPRNRVGLCASCSKNKFLIRKLGVNYKKEVALNEKIKSGLRNRLNSALKGNQKAGSAVSDLGCSVEFLKKYLEKQFKEGMIWANWSRTGWHIDHIKALAKFDLTDPVEFKKACHYTNLQPMWAKDNLRWGAKDKGIDYVDFM